MMTFNDCPECGGRVCRAIYFSLPIKVCVDCWRIMGFLGILLSITFKPLERLLYGHNSFMLIPDELTYLAGIKYYWSDQENDFH